MEEVLRLGIDSTGAEAGARRFTRSLDEVRQGAGKAAGSTDDLEERFRSLSRVATALTGVLATLGVTLGIRELAQYADGWNLVEGRISLVTRSMEEMRLVQGRVFDIAQSSRQEFESTAELYTKLARSADQLNASQNDVLAVTEAVAKSMVVSGASSQEASASIRQLGQAMASGTLRGDELNAILEQAPRLAQAIAAGMGVTVGQLRKLGAEGKLQSRDVFEAIRAQAKIIEDEFDRMPTTIGQAMTVARNNLQKFIGGVDNASEATNGFADGIIRLSRHLDTIVALVLAAGTAWVAYQVATKAAAVYTALMTAAETISAFVSLAKSIRSAADAMALFSLLGKGAVGVVAAIVAGTAGYLGYKKLLESINAETEKWSAGLGDLDTKLGNGTRGVHELTSEEKHRLDQIKEQRAANEDMVRQAEQSVALAGLQGDAQSRLRIEFDAVNKAIAARRDLTGDILSQTLDAIEAERKLALQAQSTASDLARSNKALDEQKRVLETFVENVQRSFAELFAKILDDGIHSFGDLFDGIKRMFFRLVAEGLSARLMTTRIGASITGVLTGIFGGVAPAAAQTVAQAAGAATNTGGPTPVILEGVTATASRSLFATIAPYLGVAAAGFGLGSAVGGMTSNRALGAGGGALAGAATGALIGSVVPIIGTAIGAAVGGLAGAIGGFIGSSKKLAEEQAKQREVIDKNNAQLDALRLSMDRLARISGDSLAAAGPLVVRIISALAPGGTGINALGAGDFERAFAGQSNDPRIAQLTDTYGMSLQELASIAQQVGITLFDSAGKLVPAAFSQLQKAIGLTIQAITQFGDSFDEVKRRQDAYNRLFDVADTPQNKLKDAYSILQQLAPDLLKREGIANLDLSSGAERSTLLDGLRNIFNLIDDKGLTADLLGGFADKGQLLDAILATKDGLDAFKNSLNDAATDVPKALNLALYRRIYGTGIPGAGEGGGAFAPNPVDTTPSIPNTPRFTASGSTITVQGPFIGTVVNEAGDTPETLAPKMEQAVKLTVARGGFLDLRGARTS